MNVKNIPISAVLLILLIFLSISTVQAQLKVHENGLIKLHSQAKVKVHDDVNIIGTVSFEDSEMMLEGDWNNNGTFSPGTGTVTFDGTIDQNITGTTTSAFHDLHVDKAAGNLELAVETRISNHLRMLSNTFFVLNTYDLILSLGAEIFASMSSTSNDVNDPGWNNDKFISNTAGTIGGFLVKEINAIGTYTFPVGTSSGSNGAYTPSEITLKSGTVIAPDADLKVRPIPEEHPFVEKENLSLIKFWNVLTSNITISSRTVDTYFRFVPSEQAPGLDISEYHVLRYSPSLDQTNGLWSIDPGDPSNLVLLHGSGLYGEIISTGNDLLTGDWTAGDRRAVQAEYWSRQDGPYEDPNTWSRESHTGPPATTYPTKKLDRVHIGNTIIQLPLTAAPSLSNLLEVTERIPGGLTDTPGTLRINGEFRHCWRHLPPRG
jgi:hypothetical protein